MAGKEALRYQVGSYLIGRTLGEGTFAKVKYGQHVDTGEPVAIKVLDKADIERAHMVGQIKREISIMKRLKHPNVVDLKDVMATKSKVYVVMELMTGGELFEKIAMDGPLPESVGRRMFQNLLDGLAHCHAQGVYHRDLKLENILMASDGTVKLSDFGLGALAEARAADGMLRTVCGTPNYAAPEVLASEPYRGGSADLWSLGVCLYIILAGCLPFDSPSMPDLLRRIAKADYEVPPWMSAPARDVLQTLLQPDPSQRATIADLRAHPWVAKDYKPANGSSTPELQDFSADSIFDQLVQLQPVKHPGTPERRATSRSGEIRPLNAFELINAALDISSLFERRSDVVKRHTRFTSRESPSRIAEVVEAAHVQLGGHSERNSFRSLPKLRMTLAAKHGPLTVVLEILEVIPGLRMVEFHKGAQGDAVDFYQYYASLLPLVSEVVSRSSMAAFKPALARLSIGPQKPSESAPEDATGAEDGKLIARSAAVLDAVSPPETPTFSPTFGAPLADGGESKLMASELADSLHNSSLYGSNTHPT